jgi:Arc/MetJ-type ribon-helix-helix transcriptional regulator
MPATITSTRAARLSGRVGQKLQRAESELSSASDLDDPDSLASKLDKIMQLLKEGRFKSAARTALRAFEDHPKSAEALHLLAQAESGLKWFPHFRDALVHVNLTGPTSTMTMGDSLKVQFEYSHQKPEHKTKSFGPFIDSVQGLVRRHDAKLMRNSHLPDDKVERVLRAVGGAEALQKMRSEANHAEWLASTLPKLPSQITSKIPVPTSDVGQGWTEDQIAIIRKGLQDMAEEENEQEGEKDTDSEKGGLENGRHVRRQKGFFKTLVHAKAIKEAVKNELQETLGVVRSIEEIDKVMRLTRLYDELKQLDSISVQTSGEEHQKGDWVALIQVSDRKTRDGNISHERSVASPETMGGRISVDGTLELSSSSSDAEEMEEEDDIGEPIVMRRPVPAGNVGEIDFSSASLENSTYEFRYYMKGSSTPVCVSARFVASVPKAHLQVPTEPVTCGDPWSCSYMIPLTYPHHEHDWLGVYQNYGTGPKGCFLREIVPVGNEGVVKFQTSPSFPGTYHVKYHLGQHRDVVAGTSMHFQVRLNRKNLVQETREVRLFVCSTVADMLEERSALLEHIIPVLQAKYESRLVTITLIFHSFGMRGSDLSAGLVSEEETATLEDLFVSLQEIDRCCPYFIALLGERYGWIPEVLDAQILDTYPWLKTPRNRHLLLPGIRASALEVGVLNGFLIDPNSVEHNLFFFRQQDHVRRTGVPLIKRHNFVPKSEYGREAMHRLRDEIRSVPQSRVLHYHTKSTFAAQAIEEIQKSLDAEFLAPDPFPQWRRINLISQMHFRALLTSQQPDHPNDVNDRVKTCADILFLRNRSPSQDNTLSDSRPVYLLGEAGTGKSTLIARALRYHLTRLSQDDTVHWSMPHAVEHQQRPDVLNDSSGAQVGCKYYIDVHHRQDFVLLVQSIGHESTLSTPQDVLEHAMSFTTTILDLDFEVPWDASDLYARVWKWLDLVCQKCVFFWVIDGIDMFLPDGTVEGITAVDRSPHLDLRFKGTNRLPVSPRAKDSPRTKDTINETLDHAQPHCSMHVDSVNERPRLRAARVSAQQQLCLWLLPLLDSKSPNFACTAYPNLHLALAGAQGFNHERPIDPALLHVLISSPSCTQVFDIPAWPFDLRRAYVQSALRAAKIREEAIVRTMQIVEPEIREVTNDMEPGSEEPHDNFGDAVYMRYFVREIVRVCLSYHAQLHAEHAATDDDNRARVSRKPSNVSTSSTSLPSTDLHENELAMPSTDGEQEIDRKEGEYLDDMAKDIKELFVLYDSKDKLLFYVVESTLKQDNRKTTLMLLILKYLQLSRLGLRENEILELVQRHENITSQDFVRAMHIVTPLTYRTCGLVELQPWAKKLVAEFFKFDIEASHAGQDRNQSVSSPIVMLPKQASSAMLLKKSNSDDQNSMSISPKAKIVGMLADHFASSGPQVNRQECLRDMSEMFAAMDNTERKVQELPLLLLRLGHMDALLDLITSQQALQYMGPRLLLRYVETSDWYCLDVVKFLLNLVRINRMRGEIQI